MGRKIDGARCTRSRREGSEYCLSHQKGLPQGRFDDNVFENLIRNKALKKKLWSHSSFCNIDNTLSLLFERFA